MEALSLNEEIEKCWRLTPQPTLEDIEQHITNFLETAKRLETNFIEIRNQLSQSREFLKISQEIAMLEEEIEAKNKLLNSQLENLRKWKSSVSISTTIQ